MWSTLWHGAEPCPRTAAGELARAHGSIRPSPASDQRAGRASPRPDRLGAGRVRVPAWRTVSAAALLLRGGGAGSDACRAAAASAARPLLAASFRRRTLCSRPLALNGAEGLARGRGVLSRPESAAVSEADDTADFSRSAIRRYVILDLAHEPVGPPLYLFSMMLWVSVVDVVVLLFMILLLLLILLLFLPSALLLMCVSVVDVIALLLLLLLLLGTVPASHPASDDETRHVGRSTDSLSVDHPPSACLSND